MKKKYSKIEIKSINEEGTIFTELYIDGHKIDGVRRFTLNQEVGNSIPTLTIDLNALNLKIDGQAVLYQYGMGNITDISFEEMPSKGFILKKAAEISGIDEETLRQKVLSSWNPPA